MFFEENSYDIERFKNQIQKYALCSDNFNHGVYRNHKDKALKKKYIGFNNKTFLNGLIFDIDHEHGAIAWDLVGLPKPNTIIQNIGNGHAHLLYALKKPVLKTDLARLKPLKLASAVQWGFIERLKADRAYADILMKNPVNTSEWRTTWTDTAAYDLNYLADFIPENVKTITKKRSQVYGLGRNVNLFEDLRVIAYKEVLKYKKNKTYITFYNDMLLIAGTLNNYSNSDDPLSHNEVNHICNSICKWTWQNFSQEILSQIQSGRAKKPRKANLLINFPEDL